MRLPKRSFLVLLLCLALMGCQGTSNTFAGFTFGGGGNTFSCEPAKWIQKGDSFELSSGLAGGSTTLRLVGNGPLKLGQPAELSQAAVTVPGHEGVASLVSGTLVCQNLDGSVAHGSFDLKVKTPDGREFPVVGSFTAGSETTP
jgi:hypothetical protein